MGKLFKGWTFNGVLRYDSGRPLVITMNNDLAGLLFNGVKRPNRVDGTSGVVDLSNFDPGKSSFFNKAAWTDPGPLAFGNAPARDGSVRVSVRRWEAMVRLPSRSPHTVPYPDPGAFSRAARPLPVRRPCVSCSASRAWP